MTKMVKSAETTPALAVRGKNIRSVMENKNMENQNQYLHEVVITAIVVKDGKYLVTKRSPNKKRWPNLWTVPGGRLEISDYANFPKDTGDYWYNVLEEAKNYKLIDGIYDELAMAENRRRGKKTEWQRVEKI
ncbi:MAG: hypothetical protein UW05_C0033G0007 [Candidatus Giovannonibacteria bacterium GW2011_GWC2_43_8]|nr:MAG: hypothetical protein UW05_C0033G0007 [Candidatus Giovannonibacteria bacterium GW2011_GWC2_43_8]